MSAPEALSRAIPSATVHEPQRRRIQFPPVAVLIEGHTDERGSAEYNLGPADRRAANAREF